MAKRTTTSAKPAETPARQRTEPTPAPLAGGAYDEQGAQLEGLKDAPPPERKES
jgi:hypothetical protein